MSPLFAGLPRAFNVHANCASETKIEKAPESNKKPIEISYNDCADLEYCAYTTAPNKETAAKCKAIFLSYCKDYRKRPYSKEE